MLKLIRQELLQPRGSNQVGLKQFNERVVLEAIRLNGALPKAELARFTGLTPQTIGLISSRLIQAGLLLREDPVRGRIGQPSVPLRLNPEGAFGIGIKIGRRSTDALLVDLTGKVRARLVLDYAFPDAATLLPAVVEHLERLTNVLGSQAKRLVGVGVAAPFLMGGWHRLLGLSQAQSEVWNAIDLAAEVQTMTALPVSFARDTSAACLAELVQGKGRDLKSFLYLFVDTFVGGGLVLQSRLHAGVHGNGGAVASMPLGLAQGGQPPDQLLSRASLWDLEQNFIANALAPGAAYDERAMIEPWLTHTETWTLSAANALAQTIVSGTAFTDVDAVVIDGSMTPALRASLVQQIEKALDGYNWEGLWKPTLHQGSIGSDARALGGALLPLHANFSPNREVFLKVT